MDKAGIFKFFLYQILMKRPKELCCPKVVQRRCYRSQVALMYINAPLKIVPIKWIIYSYVSNFYWKAQFVIVLGNQPHSFLIKKKKKY